ncbi:Type III restriction-modification system DNA endonuclease res [hydrothermal vent metagenome]|uniref:Type III restriction-modification system DNA endonuclease res n=1 Tax=hydrothermal vent metagenome TaxID=652676 RepID=A0A1W1BCK8_9ZZZZ
MYFHSINQSDYINAITKELRRIGLLDEKDEDIQTITLKVKESFLNHELYKNGVVYVNRKIEQNSNEIEGIEDYVGSYKSQKRYIDNQSHELVVYADEVREVTFKNSQQFVIKELHADLVRVAINQVPFFYFANLKKYFTYLKSISEFIESSYYLGDVTFTLHTTQAFEVSDELKVQYIIELLGEIEKKILRNAKKYVGSCEFHPVRISQKIPAQKRLKLKESDSPIHRVEDWYIFEPHNGTIEEMHFVEFIKANMSELQKCYSDVKLIRNEKAFDIFSFDKAQDGAKFEPDFILLLKDNNGCYHQIFCEPKGEQLFEFDSWKNEFLSDITQCTKDKKLSLADINDKALPMYENSCYKILGLPFYNNALESDFKVEFEALVL